MRNKKGFTLVELIAAIVILGLLTVFALPMITKMVSNSRDKMYINDAKKLVSQADYKLRANNSDVDKPDPGDCIVLSLMYLDNQDFDSPPNKGSYQKEKSFVVVKNTGTELEYSVMLVEKLKEGGYKGVKLVRDDYLSKNGANQYVVSFQESDLIHVETVTESFINSKLGEDYIDDDGKVLAIYNIEDISDSSAIDASMPQIISAKLTSTSHKTFNTLDATLELKVVDEDTPRKDLKVYLSTENYQETNGISYGEESASFYYNFNFADYGYAIGDKVDLYIVVVDPQGNKDRKKLDYAIHPNAAPMIDSSSFIAKRASDVSPMLTATLTLIVDDDYDDISNLSVCLVDSMSQGTISCDNYQPYLSLFNDKNQTDYTFIGCEGNCVRDGLPHYLTAYVRDSQGSASSETFVYSTEVNTPPSFTQNVQVVSKTESFTDLGSKNVVVSVRVVDDVDPLSDLNVSISDGTNTSTYSLNSDENYNNFDFELSGIYDGSIKTISVVVSDTEGGLAAQSVSYQLYQDTPPVINSFEVISAEEICSNPEVCPTTEGGNKNVHISLDVEDDVDSGDNLKVCISENEADCFVNSNPVLNNYVSYASYHQNMVGMVVNEDTYNGSSHTFHAYVVDSLGHWDHSSFTYTLYQNRGPVIHYFELESIENQYDIVGTLETSLILDVEDDLDELSQLKVSFEDNGVLIVQNQPLQNYLSGGHLTLSGSYDGSTHNVNIIVTDTYGESSTQVVQYTVYEDLVPVIFSFDINSIRPACNNPVACPISVMGLYDVYYYLEVKDDFGVDGVQVCVTEGDTCTDFQPYSNYVNGDELVGIPYHFTPIDSNNMFDGTPRELHAFVKDSAHSEVIQGTANYSIYKASAPVILSGPTITEYYDENGMAIPVVLFEIEALDDGDDSSNPNDFTIQYCYKLNGSETCKNPIPYVSTHFLNTKNFFPSSYSGKTFNIYAKLKDADNNVTISDSYSFTPYKDKKPVIESVDAIPNGNDIDVTFLVLDPLDTYKVCISQSNSCSSYSSVSYSGTDKEYHTISYDYSGSSPTGATIYLFVKDSAGNIVKKSVTANSYTECSAYYYNKAHVEYTFIEGKKYYINVNPDSGVGTEVTNEEISMSRCSGKCYSYNPVTGEDHSDIIAYYTRKITYFDRFNSNKLCTGSLVTDEYEANCSYKDCFLKDNNYDRHNIIGSYLYPDANDWTITINGVPYVNHNHYKQFMSSYNEYDAEITLTETTTRICPQCVEDGLYNFSISDSDPYIRIVEYINDPDFVGGYQ